MFNTFKLKLPLVHNRGSKVPPPPQENHVPTGIW